jgi:hypothetical protein
MKSEALEKADSRRKKQCSCEGKSQGAVIDLPFALIIRPKKAQQEKDSGGSNNRQSEQGHTERGKRADKTDSNEGEKGKQIEA